MADLLQQAAIGDDPDFRLKVRSAIVARALVAATDGVTVLPVKKLAQQVLEQPDKWAVQIARGLASKTAGVAAITKAADITDQQITAFLDTVFVAYLAVT